MTVEAHDLINLQKQIDDLKCCGNCKLYHKVKCPLVQENTMEFDQNTNHSNGYCGEWVNDDLSQTDREILCEQL